MKNRAQKLGIVFAVYLAFLFGFAARYYALYTREPNRHFAFNGEILASQRTSVRSDTEGALSVELPQIDALKAFSFAVDRHTYSFNITGGCDIKLQSGHRFVFEWWPGTYVGVGGGSPPSGPFLTIVDPGGTRLMNNSYLKSLLTNEVAPPDTFERCRATLAELQVKLEKTVAEQRQILNLLDTASLGPNEWTYWDFLYFSAITQTTLGYGDILPKSTQIRMLVTVQVMLGLVCAVFVLSLVISG